jgi:hypothetical protein
MVEQAKGWLGENLNKIMVGVLCATLFGWCSWLNDRVTVAEARIKETATKTELARIDLKIDSILEKLNGLTTGQAVNTVNLNNIKSEILKLYKNDDSILMRMHREMQP